MAPCRFDKGLDIRIDDDVGLYSSAARSIVDYRNGPDKKAGTKDDQLFRDIGELDARPSVGDSTLKTLRSFVSKGGTVPTDTGTGGTGTGDMPPPTRIAAKLLGKHAADPTPRQGF